MPLNLRASKKFRDFNTSVSYKIYDQSGKYLDARNVCSIQDRLDTRYGSSRFNTVSLGGPVQSLSSFIKTDGTSYTIAKVGTELISVSATGAHTTIKSGLSASTVHEGVNGNDRHIISVGSDGLFSWDGTTFTQLGQAAPITFTATIASGGSLITTNIYNVVISYYASTIGFESNHSDPEIVTATSPNLKIDLTDIPITADNALVDTIYIYLKNVTADGEYLFIGEIPLGTTTYTIDEESTSADTPETTHDIPGRNILDLDGTVGGNYLNFFNSCLVYTSSNKREVYISEEDLPDAFDSTDGAKVFPIAGKGGITGTAVGLYNESVLDPFLVIFKRKSIRIYSEIGNQRKMVVLSEEIGCVSNETITVKNGVVYFLSEEGFRAIANGKLVTDKSGEAITLGNGDIDDIFKTTGYVYEVNRQGMTGAFSVYYPTLDQYITWVSEGLNNAYSKAYTYEFNIGGFKPYEFAVAATCATLSENADGRDIVLFGTSNGFIMKHSILETRSDRNSSNTEVAINAFGVLPWLPEDGDFDATYNNRELILKAVTSENALTVKTFIDYNLSTVESGTTTFSDPNSGFILDVDVLDEGVLGDDRAIVTRRMDINRVGESIAIGFYQSIIGANIGLVAMQIDSSKNGNRNLSNDNEDDEGSFDTEEESYFLSPSQYAELCASYLQQIQQLANSIGSSIGSAVFQGYSARFSEMWDTDGVEDTFNEILQLGYAAPTISLSCSPSQALREKGTSVASVAMSATTVKFSDDITEVTHFRNGVLVDTEAAPIAAGGVETYTNNTAFTDTMTFYSKVYDGTTLVQSNTVTYSYVYPYYYGTDVPAITAANVALLTKSVIASDANLNESFTTSSGDVFYFAYPASYGALTSILDENGFETFSDWTLRTENITGLDGNPVSYRIYEFNNPVIALTTDYTFIR
jgi:hypothetical protein